jgi:CheY-like chemotaxis protein
MLPQIFAASSKESIVPDKRIPNPGRGEPLRYFGAATVGVLNSRYALATEAAPDLAALTAAYPILISDNDAAIVALYEALLSRDGLHMTIAYSASSALEIGRTQHISMLISDIAKPGMDGLELLRRWRADPLTRPIPFMFATARSKSACVGREAAADAYLVKPFSPRDFLDTVRHLLVKSKPPMR